MKMVATLLLTLGLIAACVAPPKPDPAHVTMLRGTTYHFKEGDIAGRGQRWHSDFSYASAYLYGPAASSHGSARAAEPTSTPPR